MALVFSAIAAWATYLLIKEVKGASAGLTAAVLLDMIGQACRPVVKGLGMWGSVKALGRGYEYIMGVVIFVPIAVLVWFPFVTEFQTRFSVEGFRFNAFSLVGRSRSRSRSN